MNISLQYQELKPFLFTIAYNMTGQVEEAEDIVQDTFQDTLTKSEMDILNVKSYLTRIVINKAIDRLALLKKQRENYPSLWLPEPYISAEENTSDVDILPYAFVRLMEDLNPIERAVFILRESFDYSYHEIAVLCETTAENCRQLLHRAKLKVKRPVVSGSEIKKDLNKKVLQEFLKACMNNDTIALSSLLKEDIQLYSDGGGKVVAARRILEGIFHVGKFLFGIIRKAFDQWSAAKVVTVNNQPALLMPDENGIYMVLILEFDRGKVVTIFIVRNPDKIFLKNSVTKYWS